MLKHYLTRFMVAVNRLNLIAVATVLLYLILIYLKQITGLNLYFLPGIILFFYLPGRLAIQLYSPLQQIWGLAGQWALSVFISLSMMASITIVMPRFAMTDKSGIALILLINVLLLAANGLSQIVKGRVDHRTDSYNRSLTIADVITLVIPLIVVVAAIELSPLASDADGFMTTLKNTIQCSCVASSFRPLFTTFFALIYRATGVPYLILFRIAYPLLFVVSTWFVFDYAKRRINSALLRTVAYLAFLSAPVIISEINIIRPQVAMIIYTLPILMLLIESWRSKKSIFALTALWFSFVALGFHELSVLLFAAALVVSAGHLIRLMFIDKKVSWQNVVIGLLIIYPYTKIFHFAIYLTQLMSSVRHAESLIPKFHWRLWFIDNYITIDGINIGWPGVQAIYFYAYSGILVLFLVVALMVWMLSKRQKFGWYFMVPASYALVFLVVAEILPRLGFFFLPNRAWVHLMLALSVIVVLLIELYQQVSRGFKIASVLGVMIIIGVLGIVMVARNNVSEVFRDELKSIKYIRSTPSNSVFFSSQDNHTLVQFYGERPIYKLPVRAKIDRSSFYRLVAETISGQSIRKRVLVSPEVKEVTQRYEDGQVVSESVKLLAKRQFTTVEPLIQRGAPVYFVYSLRKTSGINAARGYLADTLDAVNQDLYQKAIYPVAYQDRSVIILKIR